MGLEVKDWIGIIDREIEKRRKDQYLAMSKLGSSLIILMIMIWFTVTTFILDRQINYIILVILFLQNFVFSFFYFIGLTNALTIQYIIKRIDSKYPVTKGDVNLLNNVRYRATIDKLPFLFFILNICEFLIIENFLYYFVTSTLLIFILTIFIWIQILYKNLIAFTDITEIYEKLKYDILSGKITDINIIRDKFLLISDKPPEIVILNEKGEFEEF
jgi:hypothetical protein